MILMVMAALVAIGQTEDCIYKDGFESDLQPPWRVVDGVPAVVAAPDGQALELTPNSRILLDLKEPVQDFVFEAKVRFVETRPWVEAPVLIRADTNGANAVQLYLEQLENQVLAVRYGPQTVRLAAQTAPVPLEVGPWYTLKVVARGQRLGVWVNGLPALAAIDREPRAGVIGLRVGDARTQYDDVVLRRASDDESAALLALDYPETPDAIVQTLRFVRKDGKQGVLEYPDTAKPLVPVTCTLRDAGEGSYEVADLTRPARKTPFTANGEAQFRIVGVQGVRTFGLLRGGESVGTFSVQFTTATDWQADRFSELFKTLCSQVRGDRSYWKRDGRMIAANPTWVRDHIHEMKGYQFWERDLTSYVDELIALQHPEGFYYEIIGPAAHDHQDFVQPKHFLREDDKDLCWIRLEMEADIEYLMVEAAYRIWKATGDDVAMKRRLPSLERALEYDFTDPARWDAKHGALKRTFSIDTWDFTYGVSDHNRRIEPGMPMGIMHGDNSGLYQACLQLADMLRAAGNDERADLWQQRGGALRERVNKLCFNGRFYTHQILLQPVDTGVREEEILSLSNTYDINRGLPTHEMAVSIVDEYQRRRAATRDTYFAEWFSIHPPYPRFGPYEANHYINGGICGFVAGELAKAAFHHGREAYAADILNRVEQLVANDGVIRFLYDMTGKDIAGGPSGWSAAAVLSALVEGLAGIRDEATLFQTVTVAPRFPAAGIAHAYVCLRYGPSGAYVAMEYAHADRRISLRLCGDPDLYHVRILLPEGVQEAALAGASDGAVLTGVQAVEDARYFTLDIPARDKAAAEATCEVAY